MEFKDYYATLGVPPQATHDEIKRAYRKLARKFHPDVSKEPDAEARFKEIAEAHEAVIDPGRRAAYDEIVAAHARGQAFEPPPGWDRGPAAPGGGDFGDDDHSDFFASLFGRGAGPRGARARGNPRARGIDHHARVVIDLEDAYRGARRTITLSMPVLDAHGRGRSEERQLEINIPAGVREGQHLRLAGQGAPGLGGAPAGDLYLEVQFRPHPRFRVDDRDVYLDLPLAPWEAALGGDVIASTPLGDVHLTIPPGSAAGRKLRLKGRGLPGQPPGDLFAVLAIALPAAGAGAARDAYAAFARAFPTFDPRAGQE